MSIRSGLSDVPANRSVVNVVAVVDGAGGSLAMMVDENGPHSIGVGNGLNVTMDLLVAVGIPATASASSWVAASCMLRRHPFFALTSL